MNRDLGNSLAIAFGVVLLAIGAPWLIGQMRSLPHGALAARADQRIVTLEVGGMTCNGCVSAVRGRLASVTGVSDVQVLLRQRRAYVVCAKAVADTALTAAVSRAGPGFLAGVVER